MEDLDRDREDRVDLYRQFDTPRLGVPGNPLPAGALWEEDLASSRLLEYEVWNRLNAYGVLDLARRSSPGSAGSREPERR